MGLRVIIPVTALGTALMIFFSANPSSAQALRGFGKTIFTQQELAPRCAGFYYSVLKHEGLTEAEKSQSSKASDLLLWFALDLEEEVSNSNVRKKKRKFRSVEREARKVYTKIFEKDPFKSVATKALDGPTCQELVLLARKRFKNE